MRSAREARIEPTGPRRTQMGEDFTCNGSHNMYRKVLTWKGRALGPVTQNRTPLAALRTAS